MTVPAEVDTAKDTTFKITIDRSKVEGEGKVEITGYPKGVEITADNIPKDKNETLAKITVDATKAEAGTTDVTIKVTVGDISADAKTKIKVAKAGPATDKKTDTDTGKKTDTDTGKKTDTDTGKKTEKATPTKKDTEKASLDIIRDTVAFEAIITVREAVL